MKTTLRKQKLKNKKKKKRIIKHYQKKKGLCFTQLCVESTTELCPLDGPEGGTGFPLGKKPNIWSWCWKPIWCFSGRVFICSEFTVDFLCTITITPGLVAVQEPTRRKTKNITWKELHETCWDLEREEAIGEVVLGSYKKGFKVCINVCDFVL